LPATIQAWRARFDSFSSPARKKKNAHLSRQASELLAQVVGQIADGVLITDKQGFIEYVNPAFKTMAGFSADDVRGETPRILKSGLQYPAFYERLREELMAGCSVQATTTNRRKTGTPIKCRRQSPDHGRNGQPAPMRSTPSARARPLLIVRMALGSIWSWWSSIKDQSFAPLSQL